MLSRQQPYSYSSYKGETMSCSDDQTNISDALANLDDAAAAAAFRRLVRLLRHRSDAANTALMGLAGFCCNCLGDWSAEDGDMDRETGSAIVQGMPTAEWEAGLKVGTGGGRERVGKSGATWGGA